MLTAGNYEQDLYDALGARFYSARAATTIADTRRVELTDGLRPEVAVEEMINIPEATTNQVAAGGRFSAMGPNPDERLIWIDATAAALQVRYVHSSRRGDARILSKGGAPERKYTYSAFGESSDNVTGYPWRFTGQRFNSWTGLYHFKARAYSPALGRFMQPDPIGYGAGPNIYAYVTNDPINTTDSTGLDPAITAEFIANHLRHYNFDSNWNRVASPPTNQLLSALTEFGETPTGEEVFSYAIKNGLYQDFIFEPTSDPGYDKVEDAILYGNAWPTGPEEVPGDGESTATGGTIIGHEFGHSPLGRATYGLPAFPNDHRPTTVDPVTQMVTIDARVTPNDRKEEIRASKLFENPVRDALGLPRRRTYYIEGDVEK